MVGAGGRVIAGALRWNLPPVLSALASRATVLAPEALLSRHLATVAARSAFRLSTDRELQSG